MSKEEEDIEKLLVLMRNETTDNALKQKLVALVNELLVKDFAKLVQILYQIDVDEKQLKSKLQENPSIDAALIITDLIVQREEEKQRLREYFRSSDNIPADDKW